MKYAILLAALLASVSTAQAGLKGTYRTTFIQGFIANCITKNTGRYSAQAALNYCNCGAQKTANVIAEGQTWEFSPSHPFVVSCKAKHLK